MPRDGSRRWQRRERSRELHGIGEVVDGLLRERPFARGVPLGRLAARWDEVVGPKLAEVSAPASLEGGVLMLAVETAPWGAQVGFLAGEIARRANAALGGDLVREVRWRVAPTRRKPL